MFLLLNQTPVLSSKIAHIFWFLNTINKVDWFLKVNYVNNVLKNGVAGKLLTRALGNPSDQTDGMKQFNLYDILGVLAPGTVVTVGILAVFPETSSLFHGRDFSAGDFGLVVLVSYVMGNLVAGLGNFLEMPYWKAFGGQHTDVVRRNDGSVLPARQFAELEKKLRGTGMLKSDESASALNDFEWRGLTRQIYGYLGVRKLTQRIEIFNAQYGMNRGIAAGFLALVVLIAFRFGVEHWRTQVILLACAALAAYRMHRFSRYYATELFRQFLVAPAEIRGGEESPQTKD